MHLSSEGASAVASAVAKVYYGLLGKFIFLTSTCAGGEVHVGRDGVWFYLDFRCGPGNTKLISISIQNLQFLESQIINARFEMIF